MFVFYILNNFILFIPQLVIFYAHPFLNKCYYFQIVGIYADS